MKPKTLDEIKIQAAQAKIARLELALHECKQQRNYVADYPIEGPSSIKIMDMELESILNPKQEGE